MPGTKMILKVTITILSKPSGQFLFKGRSYILVVLYLFTAMDYGAVCFFNFGPSPVKEEYFAPEVKHWYKLDITDIGYLGPIYVVRPL
ncbi:hypothetical protein COOONC_16964 [Cooperia oncophora]